VRLAQPASAALAVLIFAACADGTAPDGPTDVNAVAARRQVGSVRSVAITPRPDTLKPGERPKLVAVITNVQGQQNVRSITWTSSDPSVVAIEKIRDTRLSNARVTAHKPGRALITLRSDTNLQDTLTIVVPGAPADEATVASVSVTPATSSLAVGATVQLEATARDADGREVDGVDVTWTSAAPAVAAATSDGLVQARTAGTATITATVDGKSASATITVAAAGSTPTPGTRVGHHVAPNGTAQGDGTAARPWSLAAALAHPAAVQPGDTIWLHGGTYRGAFRSKLTGTPSRHVVLRQHPGERATIDGSLFVEGSSATYWGFEVMNSSASRPDVIGVDIRAPNSRFVNLVVHDHGSNGMGFWSTAPDAEIYGTIIYNNGVQGSDRGHGHGIYAQNLTGSKRIADNVIFNQFGYGIHVYGSTIAGLTGFDIAGNVSFNNGSLSRTANAPDIFVSGGVPARRITVTDNMTYQGAGKTTAVFGDAYGAVNEDLLLRGNYLVGTTKLAKWGRLTNTDNTFAGAESVMFLSLASGQSASSYAWDRNTYASKPSQWAAFSYQTTSGTKALAFSGWKSTTGLDRSSTHAIGSPSGTRVFVRPNRYEPGRATVVVYNWSGQSTASVDVSAILPAGSRYEVRNVQNYFGTPVASGTFAGGSLVLPLAGVTPAAPVGGSASAPPRTGTQFQVFVVSRVDAGTTTVAAR
jgi:hypothetical protein